MTGPATLIFRRQMINMGTMTMEGGGNGVSDVLELDSYFATPGAGATTPTVAVGFRATFQSDSETGISPPPGNFPATVTNLHRRRSPTTRSMASNCSTQMPMIQTRNKCVYWRQ
jgi:hypothetical protein